MFTKKAKGTTRIEFELPAAVEAESVSVCGDFNDWSPTAHPLTQRRDGSWSTKVPLEPGTYRYRFLLDGSRWENDWWAEAYVPNAFGEDDSVVHV